MKAAATILLSVLALLATSFACAAQQPGKTPRVGYIRAGAPNNDPYRQAFMRGMRDLGYVEGRSVTFEFRHYGDDLGSIPTLIGDLLRAKVDIIAADPLSSGLVASLARPGGNTTGLAVLSAELTMKRLELLKEVMPQAVRIAILQQPGNPTHPISIKEIEPTVRSLALTHRLFEASGSADFERSFALMREWPADAVSVLDDPTFIAYRAAMAQPAARQRLPLICGFPEMTEAGCLFSYSVSLQDMWYRSASFVDKIFKGAKPSDLPVQHGTKFEIAINLKTAWTLGLDVPATVLARADEVIK